MREIVLDTETTGLDPLGGHRIVEIGAVELIDRSAGLHVLGQSRDAGHHDDVCGAGGMSAVMTLAERQTTGDEVSPDDDRHSNNAGHADRLDNVRGEPGIDNHLLALIRGCLDGVPKSFCSIEKVIQERHGRIPIQ